jgi:hypothetical protein
VEAVTPTAGAALSKQFSELGMSIKPTSRHVRPAGKYEKPGPAVADDVVGLAEETVVVETVELEVEDTPVVYAPGQMYRQLGFGCVAEPVDKAKKTVLDGVS